MFMYEVDCQLRMEGKKEGIHTKGAQNSFYYGEEERQLIKQEGSVAGDGRSCGGEENLILVKNSTDQKRGTTGGGRLWEGEDSPVSVIYAASKHLMQRSHPSSACTSMEHPLHFLSPPPPPPPLPAVAAAAAAPFHFHNRIFNSQDAYAAPGSMSERVQQAFSSKSHALHSTKIECNLDSDNIKSASQLYNINPKVKLLWPNYTQRRMEWLNLQEDSSNGISKVYVQSHTFASSPDEEGQASEAEGFSIYSTRDQDEESVIDFFPSANRPSSAMQLRRRSYDRVKEKGNYENKEKVKRVWGMRRRPAGGGQHEDDDNDDAEEEEEEEELGTRMRGGGGGGGGRLSSSSSKWDDAERWLTSRGPPPPPPPPPHNHIMHFNDNIMHFNKAASPQLVQAAATTTTSQDKHAPENLHEPNARISGGSHGASREAGTEMGLERMRDMATQSTPTDWSRCDSPETADPTNFSTSHYSAGPEKGAPALKTSPPRHNTPARRSVSCSKQSATKQVLDCAPAHFSNAKLNLLELESCHLDKLKLARDLPLGTSSTWQLYPDEDISLKLLEHKTPLYENAKNHHHAKVNMLEARVSAWEDVERAKHTAKFKREEAKIEAWESLQRAEAEAELRKLEVKLEKLRFEGREKIMGKLGAAQRRAQEMRVTAEAHKAEQLTRVGMRANHIRKSGQLPSSTYNVVCSLTTKIKPTSHLSFS